jgi:hypothetical protein
MASGLAALALAGGSLAGAEAASARHAPYTPKIANMYTGPSPYYTLIGGTFSGFHVTMHCWTGGYPTYGTKKWFKITALVWEVRTGRTASRTGFVSANQVAKQKDVRPCW